MKTFISCDWGTSAFRLRLVDAETKAVLTEVKTEQGIATIFNEWNNSHGTERLSFYSKIIFQGVKELEKQYHCSLENTTIVISGMASSSIGMMELSYKELPFRMDGSDVVTHVIPPSPEFRHKLLFISGAKTGEDVMRGEETKLLGCDIKAEQEVQLLILPGTHSKHVVVDKGIAVDFRTYMTGELFNLLSTKSVLSSSVKVDKKGTENSNLSFFLKGVTEAANNNVLNSIFHVRTFRLFDFHSPQQNYHYLSGLLIGSELKELPGKSYAGITLVATGTLAQNYKEALHALAIPEIRYINADEALITGQCKLFMQREKQ